jgi:hypothetical protein
MIRNLVLAAAAGTLLAIVAMLWSDHVFNRPQLQTSPH